MKSLDEILNKIQEHEKFLLLKNIIENNAYHKNEDVLSHSLKTLNLAKQNITGGFISDPVAKKSFLDCVNLEIDEIKIADLMVISALLHDIGKILIFQEGEQTKTVLTVKPNGETLCPGHEYWGSLIIPGILAEFGLGGKAVDLVQKIVRLHGAFNSHLYYAQREDWPLELLINEIKAGSEEIYLELLFNSFCDCFYPEVFQKAKARILEIFNSPLFYFKREYLI